MPQGEQKWWCPRTQKRSAHLDGVKPQTVSKDRTDRVTKLLGECLFLQRMLLEQILHLEEADHILGFRTDFLHLLRSDR